VVQIKNYCRRAGIAQVDTGPKGAVIAFRNKRFANPQGLVKFMHDHGAAVKLQADHKLVFRAGWDDGVERLRGTRALVRELATPVVEAGGRFYPAKDAALPGELYRATFHDRQLDRDSFLAPLRLALARYLRRVQGVGSGKALALLPGFLREHYGVVHLHQVAGRLLGNCVRRSLRTLRRRSGPRDLTRAGG